MRSVIAAALALLAAGCGPAARPSKPSRSWTVETMLYRDTYAEADGYAVTVNPGGGFIAVTKNGREAVSYVHVGSEVARVTREE
jgi:hypothetical protein